MYIAIRARHARYWQDGKYSSGGYGKRGGGISCVHLDLLIE
jgi:hypothetical protein